MTIQSLQFKNTQFDITDISGTPWLRLPQIGAALGYASPYKVQQVYDRNADEFTDSMTQVIELQTAGGKQQVRVFSLRGCHLLGMLARTKAAKDFRRWVLDILEKETQLARKQKALPSGLTAEQQDEVKKMHNLLVQSVPFEKQKGLAITLWSAVKAKFKTGYKDVPPEQFPEILSLMARVAVEKGAQYREQAALELETVPKIYRNQANIPFDLGRDGNYLVQVKNGCIFRSSMRLAEMPYDDSLVPVLKKSRES